ncbi:hypothetical protein BGZ47_001491 [Haplosporangium gracile]|nr:hypothetical protein BGZ47_001491 [Haplosporangium gracile]
MGNRELWGMRVWLILLSFANLATITGCYVYYNRGEDDWMTVNDWTIIIFSAILFVSYVYSFYGKRVQEKYMRVFWMLIPCLTLMGIGFNAIIPHVAHASSSSFECDTLRCVFTWIIYFVSAITGLFSLVEIGMAYAWGPLQPKNSLYESLGYNNNAQVMVVSSNQQQPQMVYAQQSGLVAPQLMLQPQQSYYWQQQTPLQQHLQQTSNMIGPLRTNDPNSLNPIAGITGAVVAQPYQYIGQQQQFQSFAQPAPLQ